MYSVATNRHTNLTGNCVMYCLNSYLMPDIFSKNIFSWVCVWGGGGGVYQHSLSLSRLSTRAIQQQLFLARLHVPMLLRGLILRTSVTPLIIEFCEFSILLEGFNLYCLKTICCYIYFYLKKTIMCVPNSSHPPSAYQNMLSVS